MDIVFTHYQHWHMISLSLNPWVGGKLHHFPTVLRLWSLAWLVNVRTTHSLRTTHTRGFLDLQDQASSKFQVAEKDYVSYRELSC